MRKFSENRFLADLYTKDSVQAVFLQELIDRIDNVAKGAGVALAGDLQPPPPVNAINVKASGEMLHVTLTHAAELTRAIEYHVEADTNPGFTSPQIVSQGSRRTHIFNLPGFTDSGVAQPWYIRAYAQYPGSKPSQPLVFGGLANPTPITLTGGAGGTKLTPLGSTGSGTASTTGQQGGSGRGKFRVSTPKVIRVGKQQAAVQPTQTTVQLGGQPVIIFTPQANGNTPPTVVVDQSGNGGIDFGGGTPIGRKLSVNSNAFVDTNGNLLLKNIASPTPTTSSPSTSSTTFATLAEMSATITTHGNPVLLIFSGTFIATFGTASAVQVDMAFFRGASQVGNIQSTTWFASAGNGFLMLAFTELDQLAAGTYTYTAQWRIPPGQAGSGFSVTNNILARQMQLVELG